MATKLAALIVVLVAFLAGPAVCQEISCFNGWVRVRAEDAHLCPPMTEPPRPRQRSPRSVLPPLPLVLGYYNNRKSRSYCPKAERIVKGAVRKAVAANPGLGAGLIRLFNHDCFVRGCDGSVLLNETNSKNKTEREGTPNKKSLRGLEVIDAAKAAIEAACPGRVSCADIVAFAARDASYFLSKGRIKIQMPGGRYDGRESFASETGALPSPFSNMKDLVRDFDKQGLNLEDMVTLSGAHSIGHARCMFFDKRFSKIEAAFADKLKAECGCDNQTHVNQDHKTPYVLDRRYYQDVIEKKALFITDDLLNSENTTGSVKENLKMAGVWERKFEKAMEKMGRIDYNRRAGQATEIRKVCWRVNNRE